MEDRKKAREEIRILLSPSSRESVAGFDQSLSRLIVCITADMIAMRQDHQKKPFQFDTGLGDIGIAQSSPARLEDFIRRYPEIPIVLVHSSYPWPREIGYLTTHFANVYADIGGVSPMISRQSQEATSRQMLELCPWRKLLWSSDGHKFPETYLLATVQARNVFKTVSDTPTWRALCNRRLWLTSAHWFKVVGEIVHAGVLTETQAIQLVEDVFFNNSNKLYNLEIEGPNPIKAPLGTEPLITLPDSTANVRTTEIPVAPQLAGERRR